MSKSECARLFLQRVYTVYSGSVVRHSDTGDPGPLLRSQAVGPQM